MKEIITEGIGAPLVQLTGLGGMTKEHIVLSSVLLNAEYILNAVYSHFHLLPVRV